MIPEGLEIKVTDIEGFVAEMTDKFKQIGEGVDSVKFSVTEDSYSFLMFNEHDLLIDTITIDLNKYR